MNKLAVAQIEKNIKPEVEQISLNWSDNPSVQKLLDVLCSIIADEYIGIAKRNPDVFKNNGGSK